MTVKLGSERRLSEIKATEIAAKDVAWVVIHAAHPCRTSIGRAIAPG